MKVGEGSTIGKSITIRGEISGSEELYVDGTVEGAITLSESRLTLGPNSRVHAELKVHDVVVHGRAEGNIEATGRVELRQPGSVQGNVSAARLSIEEGAALQGKVTLSGSKE